MISHGVPTYILLKDNSKGRETARFLRQHYGDHPLLDIDIKNVGGLFCEVIRYSQRDRRAKDDIPDVLAFPCDLWIKEFDLENVVAYHRGNSSHVTMFSSDQQTYSCVQAVKTDSEGRILHIARGHTYHMDEIRVNPDYRATSQAGVFIWSRKFWNLPTALSRSLFYVAHRAWALGTVRAFQFMQESNEAPWIHCGIPETIPMYCK